MQEVRSHFYQAIALLKSRNRDGHIENPAGFLVAALKQNWGSQINTSQDEGATFRFWYDLARELGYCQGQQVREGEQWVLLSGNWEKWESAVNRGYSVEYLRKVLGGARQNSDIALRYSVQAFEPNKWRAGARVETAIELSQKPI